MRDVTMRLGDCKLSNFSTTNTQYHAPPANAIRVCEPKVPAIKERGHPKSFFKVLSHVTLSPL